jgi:hypothetical protein
LCNTWGDAWPPIVWMPYHMLDTLLASGDADACVVKDRATR